MQFVRTSGQYARQGMGALRGTGYGPHDPQYEHGDTWTPKRVYVPTPETEPAAVFAGHVAEVKAATDGRAGYTVEELSAKLTLPAWNVCRCLNALGRPVVRTPVPVADPTPETEPEPKRPRGRPPGFKLPPRPATLCPGCEASPRPGGGGDRLCPACTRLAEEINVLHHGQTGRCSRCRRPRVVNPEAGRKVCEDCRKKHREQLRAARKDRRAAGLCVVNGCNTKPRGGRWRCPLHEALNRDSVNRSRRKKKGE